VTVGDPPPAIGVCLSGGGFRAALYALGVMRYLAEADVLRRVAVLSGVSGGSVATAAFGSAITMVGSEALRHDGFRRYVFEPFLERVTSLNLRKAAVRRWLRGRWRPRGRPRNVVLAEVLADALFPGAGELASLPDRPQVVITATELAAGRAFRFSREFLGSWDFGYAPPPADMRVATAVAASIAAPPFVPPLQLPTQALGLGDAPAKLTVTDGGVYDNLGVEWFQGWTPERRPPHARNADDLFVVNASGPLQREQRVFRGIAALNRMRKVQYAQTQATRVRWLVAEMEAGRQQGLYFGITGDPRRYRLPPPSGAPIDRACYAGALPSRIVGALAALRTDFNRFSPDEAGMLAYHGYWSAHARFASLRAAAAVGEPSWREYADMSDREAARLERELRGRRHQVGVGERLR
jgi:NTE family protein